LHQLLLSHYRDCTTKGGCSDTPILGNRAIPIEIYFAGGGVSEEDESRELSGQKALWMGKRKHYN
jgi:hypothetical protein